MQLHPDLPFQTTPPRMQPTRKNPNISGAFRPLNPVRSGSLTQNRMIQGGETGITNKQIDCTEFLISVHIGVVLVATQAYSGKDESELSFGTGEEIGLIGEQDGMYVGVLSGSGEWPEWKRQHSDSDKKGLFPKNYVKAKSVFNK